MPEDRPGLGGGQVALVLAAGDCRSDLNGGDAGDIERVTLPWRGQGSPSDCQPRSHGV